MVNVHARYLDTLEAEGYLDRDIEFLPTDKQIAERQSSGRGLTAPEFAVMIAYTKNADVDRDPDVRSPRRSGARRRSHGVLSRAASVSGSPTPSDRIACAARSSPRAS